MSRAVICTAAALTVLLLAGAASGQAPDPLLSYISLLPDAGMASCPAGDGRAYEYVMVTAIAAGGTPIPGLPWTEFFFTVTGGSVTIEAIDAQTSDFGEIRFDMVADDAIVLLDPDCLVIGCQIFTVILFGTACLEVNSFDINENGCVDLADFAIFSSMYGTPSSRGDFDWDGIVGLPDFARFSAHYLHGSCP